MNRNQLLFLLTFIIFLNGFTQNTHEFFGAIVVNDSISINCDYKIDASINLTPISVRYMNE